MSFNSANQYVGSHKVWDHVGNIVPTIEHSEGMRPHFEFKPAAWLPVQFYDKHYEVWVTIMPGKAVALDPDGCLMPAQYGLTSASVVYTQNDVDAGVIDIATGLPVASVKTVTLSNVSGTRESGWTAALAGVSKTTGFMGRFGVSFADSTRKYPIGIAPQPYFQWAGGDGSNPADLRQHNHILQHQAAVLCDYVIKLPYVPAQVASETVNKTTSGTLVAGTTGTHTRAQAEGNATGRYDDANGLYPLTTSMKVIALALNRYPIAKNTARTTLTLASTDSTDNVSTILVNEVGSLAAVTTAGDYWVDYDFGVVFIYSADGSTVQSALSGAAGTVSITYYAYETAASTVSKFASVVGTDLKPGDFVVIDSNSNMSEWAGTEDFTQIMGQIIGFVSEPDEGLSKVRTAFNPAIGSNASGGMSLGSASSLSTNAGQLDQMPGSATGGYTDLVHFAGAANKYAVINLVSR